MKVESKRPKGAFINSSNYYCTQHPMARPECKTEAHWLTDIEEAPYLMGGDKMVSEAKRHIRRARRQHSKTVIEDQYAEYLYDA